MPDDLQPTTPDPAHASDPSARQPPSPISAPPPPEGAPSAIPSGGGGKPTDETIKETLESIIIAFALAFVFRAFVVEAFVIPTGSMAPTLLGQHLRFKCDQCGYRYDTDASERATAGAAIQTTCPMCYWPNRVTLATRTGSGDRILVQKYAYSFTEPRRWDVVVFKNPRYRINNRDDAPGPRQNYIKRLVGLPGEQVAILEGDLYVAREGQPFRIARKIDARANPRWRDIQDAVWQPIYHSRYIPLDGGDGSLDRRKRRWACPWEPKHGQWLTEDRRSYRLRQTDEQNRGTLTFRFAPPEGSDFGPASSVVRYPYNQTSDSFPTSKYAYNIDDPQRAVWDAIEDIRLAVNVNFDQPETTLRLRTTARRAGAPEPIVAELGSDGAMTLRWGGDVIAGPMRVKGVRPGRTAAVELWHVDQSVLLWVDGALVADHRLELTWDQVVRRPPIEHVPEVSMQVEGGPATLYQVELDRDLYYGARDQHSGLAHGAFTRGGPRQIATGEAVDLAADEFFVIGDNGPISDDARFWNTTTRGEADLHPWIEATMFADDQRSHVGRVPRRLMVGRAFFVYYPAPFQLEPEAPGVFPNFGRMRLIY
ncbi:MAG: signal peptidase I [Planctomycetes bacterium]|jgi:signal peptidase I|nr:signal peptidase I [Planctomycetota bacterium]